MAGKSLEQRLAALKEKQATIAEQIKKIETEQSRQLRKEKQEKARIIGLAMLRRVEQAQGSKEELLALIAPFVISGKERQFLGLATQKTTKQVSAKISKAEEKVVRSQPKTSRKKNPPDAQNEPSLSEPTSGQSKRSTTKRLLPTASDESLMAEFNL